MLHHGLARFMGQEQAAIAAVLSGWQELDDELSASISALETSLVEAGWSGQVDATESGVTLSIDSEKAEPTALCQQLYGVLCEAAPSPLALAFLRVLAVAKGSGKELGVRAGETELLSFPVESQISADDLEELLAECYDRWDAASLGR